MTAEDTTQAGLANGTHVVLTSAYDAAGNRTLSALKIGSVYDAFTLSSFDSLNRVTTLQQFDLAQGLGASLIDGFSGDSHALDSKRVDYTYDANGQVIAEIRYAALDGSDPVAATYTRYDTMGHVTELDHILYDGTGAMEMTAYAYDAGGRMIRQTGSLGTSTYAYDGDSQLIGSDVAGPNGAESYTYDANGNRTGTAGGAVSGSANNQVATLTDPMTGGNYLLAHDAQGNQTRRVNVDNSSTTLYAYDHRNRMTSASEAGSYSASYTYDAFDRRIGKSVDYAVSADLGEHYLWDGNDLLAVLNDNGSVSQRYLMGPGQNQVLAEETVGDTTRWALTDTIGTVRTGVDNASGHAVLFNIALADSFGNSDQNLSGVGIRMGFTGYQYDKESGDYYAEARYYSPLQGKFTSEDPRGFEAGDPNLGRYVGNNPLTYTDPSGMTSQPTMPSVEPLGPQPYTPEQLAAMQERLAAIQQRQQNLNNDLQKAWEFALAHPHRPLDNSSGGESKAQQAFFTGAKIAMWAVNPGGMALGYALKWAAGKVGEIGESVYSDGANRGGVTGFAEKGVGIYLMFERGVGCTLGGAADAGGSAVDLTHASVFAGERVYGKTHSVTKLVGVSVFYQFGSLVGARQIYEASNNYDLVSGQQFQNGFEQWGRAFEGISAAAGTAATGMEIGGIDLPLDMNTARAFANRLNPGNYSVETPGGTTLGMNGGGEFRVVYDDPGAPGLQARYRQGSQKELESAFAKIEPKDIGTGTPTTPAARDLARSLGNVTDDAGHAIGKNLGGLGGANSGNIIPQAPGVNRGAFAQFEQQVARQVQEQVAGQAGNQVYVRVIPRYAAGATRPYEIAYQVRVNGVTTTRVFPNP